MRMHTLTPLAAVAALVALPAAQAENCSTLDASVTLTEDATTASLDVTGSTANAFTFLVVGDTAGEFPLDLGDLGGVTLGVAPPFAALPLGTTDGDGNLSVSFEGPGVPDGVPTETLHAQSVSFGFELEPGVGLSLDLCESNVVTLEL